MRDETLLTEAKEKMAKQERDRKVNAIIERLRRVEVNDESSKTANKEIEDILNGKKVLDRCGFSLYGGGYEIKNQDENEED